MSIAHDGAALNVDDLDTDLDLQQGQLSGSGSDTGADAPLTLRHFRYPPRRSPNRRSPSRRSPRPRSGNPVSPAGFRSRPTSSSRSRPRSKPSRSFLTPPPRTSRWATKSPRTTQDAHRRRSSTPPRRSSSARRSRLTALEVRKVSCPGVPDASHTHPRACFLVGTPVFSCAARHHPHQPHVFIVG